MLLFWWSTWLLTRRSTDSILGSNTPSWRKGRLQRSCSWGFSCKTSVQVCVINAVYLYRCHSLTDCIVSYAWFDISSANTLSINFKSHHTFPCVIFSPPPPTHTHTHTAVICINPYNKQNDIQSFLYVSLVWYARIISTHKIQVREVFQYNDIYLDICVHMPCKLDFGNMFCLTNCGLDGGLCQHWKLPGIVWSPILTNTVKPVYNDHLMGYFSAFWSSSRWPRAKGHLDELQKAGIVNLSKLAPSVFI